MTIVVDCVETSGKGPHVVQITIGPADPGKDYPAVRVRVPMGEDEIGTLSLHEIHSRAIQKVPELLRSVLSILDEETRPSRE